MGALVNPAAFDFFLRLRLLPLRPADFAFGASRRRNAFKNDHQQCHL
jgi:hypothetical protein